MAFWTPPKKLMRIQRLVEDAMLTNHKGDFLRVAVRRVTGKRASAVVFQRHPHRGNWPSSSGIY